MQILTRRLWALLVILALTWSSHLGLCAGWLATPEARMACCSEGGSCPMHKSDSPDATSRAISQAEADSCCAKSEQQDSAPSTSFFVLSVSLAVIPSPGSLVAPATAAQLDAWRTHVPVQGTHAPTYLLLSVLLV